MFKEKMKEAMDWFKGREIGMVITKTDPPARGKYRLDKECGLLYTDVFFCVSSRSALPCGV